MVTIVDIATACMLFSIVLKWSIILQVEQLLYRRKLNVMSIGI